MQMKYKCTSTIHVTVTKEIEAPVKIKAKQLIENELISMISHGKLFDYINTTVDLAEEEPEEE